MAVHPTANSGPRDVSAVNECFVPERGKGMRGDRRRRRTGFYCISRTGERGVGGGCRRKRMGRIEEEGRGKSKAANDLGK